MTTEVHPATPDRWDDVVAAFGSRGDDPAWCWCQLFLRDGGTGSAPADNRAALLRQIRDADVPPGVIAYVDGRPVGWSRVGPREAFPALRRNRALAKALTAADPAIWWVTCLSVNSRYRRSGVGRALLEADVEFAREHGARAVEGHPVDVARLRAAKVSGSAIFTGTRAMFEAAGFIEVARTAPTRPVMRCEL